VPTLPLSGGEAEHRDRQLLVTRAWCAARPSDHRSRIASDPVLEGWVLCPCVHRGREHDAARSRIESGMADLQATPPGVSPGPLSSHSWVGSEHQRQGHQC